jgi:hypothetical protein
LPQPPFIQIEKMSGADVAAAPLEAGWRSGYAAEQAEAGSSCSDPKLEDTVLKTQP